MGKVRTALQAAALMLAGTWSVASLAAIDGLIFNDTDPLTIQAVDMEALTVGDQVQGPANPYEGSAIIPDCAIASDGDSAFFTAAGTPAIYPVDLTGATPQVGTAIPVTGLGALELALTPDNAYVLVATLQTNSPPFSATVSVIDTQSQAELSSTNIDPGTNAVAYSIDVCDDGETVVAAVLDVGSGSSARLARGSLSADGVLSAEAVVPVAPLGIGTVAHCAPGSETAVHVKYYDTVAEGPVLSSFTLADLTQMDSLVIPIDVSAEAVLAIAFSPNGDVLYILTNDDLRAVQYDPDSGLFGDTQWLTPASNGFVSGVVGNERMALSEDGSRLLVGDTIGPRFYDAETGALLESIAGPPTGGVCLQPTEDDSPVGPTGNDSGGNGNPYVPAGSVTSTGGSLPLSLIFMLAGAAALRRRML
jgi:hypothetical protein